MSLIGGTGARGGLKGAGDGVGAGSDGTDEGWIFIEPTDQEFIDAHPQLVQREAERWQAIAPWWGCATCFRRFSAGNELTQRVAKPIGSSSERDRQEREHPKIFPGHFPQTLEPYTFSAIDMRARIEPALEFKKFSFCPFANGRRSRRYVWVGGRSRRRRRASTAALPRGGGPRRVRPSPEPSPPDHPK